MSFLQAVLDLPAQDYEEITIIDPHLKRESETDKLGIIDVKLRTKSGKVIDIEIQVADAPDFRERIVLYNSKMVAGQIGRGDQYAAIKRVISIVITDFVLLPEEAAYHNVYRLLNTKTHTPFTDLIEYNILELSKLPAEDGQSDLWMWMKFLTCEKREEFEMVAERNPQVKKAVAFLMELSEDERTRMLEEAREKERRDWASRMRGAREEGISQGIVQGISQGIVQGALKRAVESAVRLKKLGVPLGTIAEGTGLSPEEVARL
jgi:predicted transposase/invertase (TIGR01784 family)